MNQIHYALYGPNADGTFDCGETRTCGGYTGDPNKVTCLGCKRKSPGLWPEHQEKALDRDTLEAVAKLADERKLPHFAQDIRDLGKPRVKIRMRTMYEVQDIYRRNFDTLEEAEAYLRHRGDVPEMDYSDDVVELTEADVVPEPLPVSHLLPHIDVDVAGCPCERCEFLRTATGAPQAKPANGPPARIPGFCTCDMCRHQREFLEAEACAR